MNIQRAEGASSQYINGHMFGRARHEDGGHMTWVSCSSMIKKKEWMNKYHIVPRAIHSHQFAYKLFRNK